MGPDPNHCDSQCIKGVFTLTETETNKMGLKPIGIGHCICLGQYEHLHIIPYNPFLTASVSVSVNTYIYICYFSIIRWWP